MLKCFVSVLLLLGASTTRANTIEIQYHVTGASQVTMIWGVNDWKVVTDKPHGTIIKDKVMQSPMVKAGDYYVLKITVPDSSTIDYLFQFTKKMGPFKTTFYYLDINEQPENTFYHSTVNDGAVIRVSPDLKKVKPSKEISLLHYAVLLFFAFCIPALLVLALKKIIFKSASSHINYTALFGAIPLTLLCMLMMIRAIITGEAVQFLISPGHALPLMFKTSYYDFLYVFLLTLLFVFFFFIKKNRRTLILYLFGSFAILSIIIAIANIQITALLGRPFTYQWLYYSDFLSGTDATRAIKANIQKNALAAYAFIILAAIPLAWLVYQLLITKPAAALLIFIVGTSVGYFAKDNHGVSYVKRENPVVYFLSSLFRQNGLSVLSNKNSSQQHEFEVKNKNIVQPKYADKFAKANIKNVIVFVLESTPAEYITPYNYRYAATPFLDSIKSSAVLFNDIYAHAPATNKSMVSILCGAFPYLSYESLTVKKPGIKWPSISSELKKNRYRTSFFNSGDNRYQGAENFLRFRGLDKIEDFRQNSCEASTFSDSRFENENQNGIKDSCLSVKFFNWLKDGDQSVPFFSMMWTYQTHYPYYVSGKRINFHVNNESKEKYLNALHDADKTLQQLVTGLEKRDLLKSTLIVVLGDHGEAFGKHGQTAHASGIFEENLHIPLILINPLLFKGERIDEAGGTSDVAPTIFSILNKPIPEQWQGENLFSTNRRDKVYFFSPYSDYLFGCRQGNYKFIYNATTNISALYDLKTDPLESVNIADKHPKYTEELSSNVNAWIQYQSNYVDSFLK